MHPQNIMFGIIRVLILVANQTGLAKRQQL
jgi:hypothetical protein